MKTLSLLPEFMWNNHLNLSRMDRSHRQEKTVCDFLDGPGLAVEGVLKPQPLQRPWSFAAANALPLIARFGCIGFPQAL
jgi:hypothetical protein